NLIDWIVELNFGNTAIPPKGEFDLQSYASFNEIIQAVQNKIPVSKEALYTRYKLPRPKDDDDIFILEGTNSIALSDSDKKKIQSRLPLKIK
ncbi:MAG: hypothetical protein P1P66_05830, partial [Treponema pedis]